MADTEVAPAAAPAAAPVAAPAVENKVEAPIAAAPMDLNTALKTVLRTSVNFGTLARGLRESLKAIDRHQAHLCVMSSACDEENYVKLVTSFCQENNIPLLKVEDPRLIGEWAGICKMDKEGKAVKVVPTSCVVVTGWGEESEARQIVIQAAKNAK